MDAGEVWKRVVGKRAEYGMRERPVGERIEIEEIVEPYSGPVAQARFVVLDGPNKGLKDQWAVSYIEKEYEPVGEAAQWTSQ